MKKLFVTIAAAALVGVPLAVQAQDRDGYQGERSARPAMSYGRDASARAYDRDARRGAGFNRFNGGALQGDRFDRGRQDRGRLGGDRFGERRFGADRSFDRAGRDRFGGGVALGFGYGGYPYGGYYAGGDYPYGGYGADDAYTYPDEYGTYQPFDYAYSGDDAYDPGLAQYGDEGAGYDSQAAPYDGEGYDDQQPAPYGAGYDRVPPDQGWSAGAPPADCGQWVWREGRGAYEWIPAPCERAP